MKIVKHYSNEKQQFLDHCIQCGICADVCPVLPYTTIGKISSQEIQKAVFDSIENDRFNHFAYTKAFACMECFKCTTGICPHDLNPMLINEIIKGGYTSKGNILSPFTDSQQPCSTHRILASVQVSKAEYKQIMFPTPEQNVKYVFFPGCNVYFQPEKILNALDILDSIGESYAFLPGLDYCCGDNHLFFGHQKEGSCIAEELVAKIANYNPEAVLLWCPTCHCRFDKYISPSMSLPFQILSFPQYLSTKMEKLKLTSFDERIVTLHEPCKSVYTGVDRNGPRQVLSQLPGVTLKEMKHHGTDTLCCGSGAICWFPESCSQIEDIRLLEAKETGADQMITVCHYCNQAFASKEAEYDFQIVSYISIVAEAMGIHRRDKFKEYMHWKDLELILKDMEQNIETSVFGKEKIIEVLQAVFLP